MEGFKRIVKMKTGGSVSKAISAYEKKERKVEEKADIAQDKAVVKKAIAMHDKQEHKGEKTDLSKLKKGGRAKKEKGTVKKFKAGGNVNNVYEAKKSSGDKDAIKKVKQITPAKAAAPSKASVKSKFKGSDVSKEKAKASGDKDKIKKTADTSKKAATPSRGATVAKGPDVSKFCKGGKAMKKYATGGSVDVKDPQALVDKIALEENTADRELVMRPLRALKNMATGAAKKFMGQGAISDAERANAPSAPVNQSSGSNINRKEGGSIQCMADGGLTASEKEWMGGADVTDPYILARMRAAIPAAVRPQGAYMANANPEMDNRDVGAGYATNYILNANPAMDNRDVGMPTTPVRRAAPSVIAPRVAVNSNYIPNANPAMDNRDVGMVNKPAPYIDIPKRAAGMQQYNQDATSPAGNFFRWLTSNQSQRNKRKG